MHALCALEVFGEIVDNLYRFHEDEMGKKNFFAFLTDFQLFSLKIRG